MTIDIFSIEQFQEYIDEFPFPNHKKFVMGEYTWYLEIDQKSQIEIRSSIGGSGVSSDVGKNSIRLRLENSSFGEYLAKTDEKYITRVMGWRDRVREKVYELIQLREKAGDCPKCAKPKLVLRSHTLTNPNRRFCKCANHPDTFTWID